MMDKILLRACSDCVLERPVLSAMAETNSAFLKLITSSFLGADLVADDFFFLAAFLVPADFFFFSAA